MKTAVIPADTDQPVRFEEVPSIGLGYLQGQVGGYVQVVSIRSTDVNVYLNEEGKMKRLPPNKRASRLARRNGAISLLDTIVGDVVIVGPVDDEGYDTGLTEDQASWLLKELK
jgi:Domain of unknown function (DUF3846)